MKWYYLNPIWYWLHLKLWWCRKELQRIESTQSPADHRRFITQWKWKASRLSGRERSVAFTHIARYEKRLQAEGKLNDAPAPIVNPKS